MSNNDIPAGLNPSDGGKARAKKLSRKEREEIARRAADARWSIPQATHLGTLKIADREIECAVLQDGRRLLGQQSMTSAIGRRGRPNQSAVGSDESCFTPPPFLAADNLKP